MSFQISDKVVCVRKQWRRVNRSEYTAPSGVPEYGKIYVVSGTTTYDFRDEPNCPCIFIVGLTLIWSGDGSDTPWPSQYFRKLTDIQEENRLRREQEVGV